MVRQTDQGWQTLMLRAYRNWDFPKGLCEDGETPKEAATDTGPYNQGKVARYFLARTEQEEVEMGISEELGRPEHHEYRWMDFDQAYDIASPRVRLIVQWARQVIGT